MRSASGSRLSWKESLSHSGVSLRSSGRWMSTGDGPHGSTPSASRAHFETTGRSSAALAFM